MAGASEKMAEPWWDYPRFNGEKVRVLLVSLGHLLVSELVEGFRRQGHTCRVLFIPGEAVELEKIERLYEEALRAVKPDFLLTVNHRGFDREGFITRMLEGYRIPFASWYVDSPQLIIGHYKENNSSCLTLFLWDRDYCRMFRKLGFERVEYLPLGVDERLFNPKAAGNGKYPPMPVSFVGNSMFHKAGLKLAASGADGILRDRFGEISEMFIHSRDPAVRDFIEHHHPDCLAGFQRLGEVEAFAYETAVTWYATGLYRFRLVKRLSGFNATIAGDPGWEALVGGKGFGLSRELNYYDDLPAFYASSTLCFNATSRQMKRGVNQRIFDVPASGRAVLTDRTDQLVDLMEPGKEVLAYRSPDEIPPLVERALKDRDFLEGISMAGHRRVVEQHTYCRRVSQIVNVMKWACS
jgi:spore maturation protein CgeB